LIHLLREFGFQLGDLEREDKERKERSVSDSPSSRGMKIVLTFSSSSFLAAALDADAAPAPTATFLTPVPATVLDLGPATEGLAEVVVELLATLARPERAAGVSLETVAAPGVALVAVVGGRDTVEGRAVVEERGAVEAPVVEPTGFLAAEVPAPVAEGLEGDEEVVEATGRRTAPVVEVVLATLERGAVPAGRVVDGVVLDFGPTEGAVEVLEERALAAVPEIGGLVAVVVGRVVLEIGFVPGRADADVGVVPALTPGCD